MKSHIGTLRTLLLCVALGFSLHASAAADFLHFASWQEAADYYTNIAPALAASDQSETLHVIPRDQAPYKNIETIVDLLTQGFAKYFPAVAAQGKAPYVLIVDGDEENAFAMRDLTSDKNPYVFVVYRGILKTPLNQLTGTIAHELTHLFLQYKMNDTEVPESKYYLKDSNSLKFGPQITNVPALKEKVETIEDLYDYAGPYSNVELGRVPLDSPMVQATNVLILKMLVESKQDLPVCVSAKNDGDALLMFSQAVLDENMQFLVLGSAAVRDQLSAMSAEYEKDLKECLKGVRIQYEDFLTKMYSVTPEIMKHLKETMKTKDKANFDKYVREFAKRDAVEIILEDSLDARTEMRQIESQIQFENVRIYTDEDDADEIAVYILTQLGLDTNSLSDFLVTSSQNDSCDLTAEPTIYGPLGEPHHDSCWRAYRNNKYAEYLKGLSVADRDAVYVSRKSLVRPVRMYRAN